MKVNDYTQLPLGTQLEGGEIRICPQCGKAGLAQDSPGKVSFTHSETCDFDEQSEPVMDWVTHIQLVPVTNTPLSSD
jgi:hypothetical protein